LSLKHDNSIKDRKNVTIFLGKEIKMQGLSRITKQTVITKFQARFRGRQLRNKQLRQAVLNRDIPLMNWLITNGVNVNAQNRDGYTPLHIAVRAGNIDIVDKLLAKGANVNVTDNMGRTALHLAENTDYLGMLKYFASLPTDGKYEFISEVVLDHSKPELLSDDMSVCHRQVNGLINFMGY
tara:strand:- start:1269 stop:1811 length:543 start_codon:yes stop_codon:yes gene_type:complete